MSVGRRLARLRAAHGESLREAARRTGISHTTIARIEKGEVTGSFHHTLQQIAQGYGVPFQYLLSGGQELIQTPTTAHLAVQADACPVPPEQIGEYLRLARKAADADLKPEQLSLVIDLLIMREGDAGLPEAGQ